MALASESQKNCRALSWLQSGAARSGGTGSALWSSGFLPTNVSRRASFLLQAPSHHQSRQSPTDSASETARGRVLSRRQRWDLNGGQAGDGRVIPENCHANSGPMVIWATAWAKPARPELWTISPPRARAKEDARCVRGLSRGARRSSPKQLLCWPDAWSKRGRRFVQVVHTDWGPIHGKQRNTALGTQPLDDRLPRWSMGPAAMLVQKNLQSQVGCSTTTS